MIGAGVFAAIGPAAEAAGNGLLIGLAIAAVVAYCNATSLAAARGRLSGVGRHLRLRPRAARPVLGVPRRLGLRGRQDGQLRRDRPDRSAPTLRPSSQRPLAVAAVVALTAVNYRGVRKTVAAHPDHRRGRPRRARAGGGRHAVSGGSAAPTTSASGHRRRRGILRSAGLLFFAFAGYARIATLGEEVATRPARSRGHPACARHHPRRLRRRRRQRACRRRPDCARPLRRAARHRRGGRRARRAGPGRADRRRRRGARRPAFLIAGVSRTAFAMAADGISRGGSTPSIPSTGPAPRRAGGRGDRGRAGDVRRPPGRHRLQLVRRAHLLRHRQRRGLDPAAPSTPLAAPARRWPSRRCAVLAVTLPAATVVTGAAVLAAGAAGCGRADGGYRSPSSSCRA